MKVINWKTSSDFSLLIDTLRESEEEVTIVIAKNTPVGWFHIQILRQLFPHGGFVFICRDNRIKKILKQSGYRVFSSMQEMNRILPEDYKIIQENLSMFDYIRFHSIRFISRIFSLTKKFQPRTDVFSVKHSSWYMLVIGIVVILLLMVGIVSLTTPHAAIIITPQASIQNAVRNVTFVLESDMNDPLQIPVRKTILPFELKKTYNVNTYDPTTLARARGTIKIINSGPESFKIKPQTRVIIDTLVFRTEEWIDIPASDGSKPTEVTVSVIADPVWSDGVLIWKKWNIVKDTVLSFPGLSKEESANLSITAVNDFRGGDDVYKNVLTQEEYTRIEKIFRDQLIQDARKSLLDQFWTRDEFMPIPIPEAIKELDVSVESDVAIGDHVKQVTFSGKGDFIIYIYHVETLRNILLSAAHNHLLENTESLVEIPSTPPDIIEVLSRAEEPWAIKATARIPIQVLYDFSSNAGQKTIQNTLSDLLDSDTERAEKTLLNHPYIKSIDIRLTPFWANKLPNSLDRMYIKVQEVKY